MPKIAIVNLGAHGHVNPTLAVTSELVRLGAEVVYYVPSEFEDAVQATGARFAGIDSLFGKFAPPKGGNDAELMASFPTRLLSEARHTLPQLLPRLREQRPDVIIYDKMAMAGRFAAEILGTRKMLFCPSYAANQHFSLGRLFANPDLTSSFDAFAAEMAALANEYGVQAITVPGLFTTAEELNIVFLPRAFQYEGDSFDSRFAFVGPSIAARPTSGRWQPPGSDNRRLLLISLGTVFNDWPEFFSMALAAFADTDWHVVMAIGKHVDLAALGTIPANFEVSAHVPQLDVLQHADAFISHGGMNSTQEALYYGVPLVVIPQMLEQAATARRVTELGLGRALTRDTVSTNALRETVEAVSSDAATAERLAIMREAVRAAGGQKRAAAAILAQLDSPMSEVENQLQPTPSL